MLQPTIRSTNRKRSCWWVYSTMKARKEAEISKNDHHDNIPRDYGSDLQQMKQFHEQLEERSVRYHKQRLTKELEQVESHENPWVHRMPSNGQTLRGYLSMILVVLCVAFVVYWTRNHAVPRIPSNDLGDNWTTFSEYRAKRIANELVDTIGKRVVGSKANEKLAVKFILDELYKVQSFVQKQREQGVAGVPFVDIEVQYAHGAHIFHILDAVITNVYSNITNIVARIYGDPAHVSQSSLLINAHFDTTIGTQGGADDAVPVSVMLEMLNVLAHHHTQNAMSMTHNVIFLFNGAEESLQEGSHAFITLHPWAKYVHTVINLEACGSGGPELLFQVGSAELLSVYASVVPYPHGSSIGNDIFATGVIQSDTDYRIFKGYGKSYGTSTGPKMPVLGFDMAYYRNSYVYHTMLDDLSIIEEGSIQHMGDNALSLVLELATTKSKMNSGLLDKPHQNTKGIFFDILGGAYMVSYNMRWAVVMHTLAIVAGIYFAAQHNWFIPIESTLRPIVTSVWSVFVSFNAGLLFPVFIGLFLTAVGKEMLYFSNPLYACIIYGFPSIIGILYAQWRFFESKIDPHNPIKLPRKMKKVIKQLEWNTLLGVIGFHMILLAMTTIATMGISYVFFLWYSSLSLVMVYNYYSNNYGILSREKTTGGVRWNCKPLSYILGFLIPALPTMEVSFGIVDVFVPLIGRVGHFMWSEALIGGVFGVLTNLNLLITIPLAHRVGNLGKVVKLLGAIYAVLLVWICFTAQPYNQTHPKRVFFQHTKIMSQDRQSSKSYLVAGTPDAINLERSSLPEIMAKDESLGRLLKQRTSYSGLEYWDSVYPFSYMLQKSGFMFEFEPEAEESEIIRQPTLKVLQDTYSNNSRILSILYDYTGNEWCTLRIDDGKRLLKWSVTDELPPMVEGHYLLRHVGGHGMNQWNITLHLRGPEAVTLNLSASHFVTSSILNKIYKTMPKWTAPTGFVTVLSQWTL